MSTPKLPGRAEVLEMLAALGRPLPGGASDAAEPGTPATSGGELGSLETAWLVAQAEQRYGVLLDALTESDLVRMSTLDGAVEVLREQIGATQETKHVR